MIVNKPMSLIVGLGLGLDMSAVPFEEPKYLRPGGARPGAPPWVHLRTSFLQGAYIAQDEGPFNWKAFRMVLADTYPPLIQVDELQRLLAGPETERRSSWTSAIG